MVRSASLLLCRFLRFFDFPVHLIVPRNLIQRALRENVLFMGLYILVRSAGGDRDDPRLHLWRSRVASYQREHGAKNGTGAQKNRAWRKKVECRAHHFSLLQSVGCRSQYWATSFDASVMPSTLLRMSAMVRSAAVSMRAIFTSHCAFSRSTAAALPSEPR